ncbi:helix-turn-helix domain-containing protein [Caulobacter sp. BP25]|uniref:helix-turn-helix domain-containing protein n=1 Tax=Caulobacter sp. BP25 TaxID=2048900 RepID=UPI000C12A4C2|nr:helix-turn-helix domain-containing protein [Caulobacter sp. BP25]PHY17512.1 transcriptional regulator [Caulobacter sp. BP25]
MDSRGDRLSHAIKGRGISKMMALALDLDVHESAISRWRKNGPMSLENAARISEVLDISLDWLVLGRGEMDGHTVESLASEEFEYLRVLRKVRRRARVRLMALLEEMTEPT